MSVSDSHSRTMWPSLSPSLTPPSSRRGLRQGVPRGLRRPERRAAQVSAADGSAAGVQRPVVPEVLRGALHLTRRRDGKTILNTSNRLNTVLLLPLGRRTLAPFSFFTAFFLSSRLSVNDQERLLASRRVLARTEVCEPSLTEC